MELLELIASWIDDYNKEETIKSINNYFKRNLSNELSGAQSD